MVMVYACLMIINYSLTLPSLGCETQMETLLCVYENKRN